MFNQFLSVKRLYPSFLTAAFFISTVVSGQEKLDVTSVFTAHFFWPGLAYEQRIANKQTIVARAYLNLSIDPYATSGFGANFYLDPALNVEYRYYYNMAQRDEKDKRIEMNSANYLAGFYDVALSKRPYSGSYFAEDKKRPLNKLGVLWGMQRNYKKRFSLNFQAGAAYFSEKGTVQSFVTFEKETVRVTGFMPVLDIQLGFWLNRQ